MGHRDVQMMLDLYVGLDKLHVMYDAAVYIGGVTWYELKFI